MEITYNNNLIQYNDFLTPSQTSNEPSLKITNLGYKFYTLIMYDPDAVKGTYWHWILANINSIENIDTKSPLLGYSGPNPPDTKKHRYIFELYGTNDKILVDKQFDTRRLSLEEGKKRLQLENNPIISTQFLSQREKGGTNKNQRKTKRIHKNNRTNKNSIRKRLH